MPLPSTVSEISLFSVGDGCDFSSPLARYDIAYSRWISSWAIFAIDWDLEAFQVAEYKHPTRAYLIADVWALSGCVTC